MEKHFMLDIEATGIDPDLEDLLQVGVLEVDFMNGLWRPGRCLEITLHTDRQPESSFAKEHMVELYERCRQAPAVEPEVVRHMLLDFFRRCGRVGAEQVKLMGWNASNYDVPFLVAHDVLVPNSYQPGPGGNDVMVGDFHYRIYEMGGAVSFAQNVLKYDDRDKLLKDARAMESEILLPAGKDHEALYDCYDQVKLLNGLIKMVRHRLRNEVSCG